ncbi:outer membrane lipoprotein carrier protein LolA [Paraburkholderia megapolitana]|uniref:outer membrane lipoprotein carrier protein LolA n=1 Tax=Paraburkholderia megapolitana TaxID=420953 RepID=UPI0038B6D758
MVSLTLRAAIVTLFVAACVPGTTAFAAAAPPSAAAADSTLVAQIAAHLGQAPGIRARFTQTQTLSAMKQPLVSRGSLLFVRALGVIWQIESPYKATYVITDTGVVEVNPQGQRIATQTASGTRGVAQVSRMMRAMLGGDLSSLYSQFDVHAQGTSAQWRMQLTPNQPQLAQSIRSLQMTGGTYLQTLHIAFANGDATQLDFANTTPVEAPTPAERTLFGAP